MRRNRLLALALGLVLALTCLSACGTEQEAGQRHRVALVAKSTQTEFWLSVFAGAQAAAAEYNMELTTMGPETEEDYETQNRMIAEVVESGAEALVFSAIDFTRNAAAVDAELLALDRGEVPHLSDVRAGHEGAARAGEDDHVDLVVGRHLVDGCIQIIEHLAVERVERLLPVNGQNPHMSLLLDFYKSQSSIPP